MKGISTRVLVVEDDPDQLALISAFLQREGCIVFASPTAEDALGLPPDLGLHLMIIDLVLPGVDGWQLAATLRQRYPGAPLAIASVLDAADYPPHAHSLRKPVTRSAVKALLELVRAQAATR